MKKCITDIKISVTDVKRLGRPGAWGLGLLPALCLHAVTSMRVLMTSKGVLHQKDCYQSQKDSYWHQKGCYQHQKVYYWHQKEHYWHQNNWGGLWPGEVVKPWPGHSVVSVHCDTKRGESMISLLKKSMVIHWNKTYCGVRISETSSILLFFYLIV